MDGLKVTRLPDAPSPDEFASRIEPRNVPVVFDGCVKAWPAYNKWLPSAGGIDHLKSIAGSATVQIMVSKSGSNFYGDIRGHERAAISFGEFLDFASSSTTQESNCDESDSSGQPPLQDEQLGIVEGKPDILGLMQAKSQGNGDSEEEGGSHPLEESQLYLAQAAIYNKEQNDSTPLRVLMQDILTPAFLEDGAITNINLWMSINESRSSPHYDPYHNILCVVTGCKKVTLWPPSTTPLLYPFPVYGEASNHSGVDFVEPDLHKYPLFKDAIKHSQAIILDAGDALFIPEGWYHQVDSKRLTIAVNFWWPSEISLALNSHMDAYYLRRIVASLVDHEKVRMLEKDVLFTTDKGVNECIPERNMQMVEASQIPIVGLSKTETGIFSESNKSILQGHASLEQLTPVEWECLQSLVISSPGRAVKLTKDPPSVREAGSWGINGNCGNVIPMEVKQVDLDSCKLGESVSESRGTVNTAQEEDLVAKAFLMLEPMALQQLLLLMVDLFPRTLEALILHGVSPVAAELLTRKFDEMDKLTSESQQAEFYKIFYSVFDDPQKAMAALLDGKEAFAAMALGSTMERYLGLYCSPLQKH